jgi:hypothetical protein
MKLTKFNLFKLPSLSAALMVALSTSYSISSLATKGGMHGGGGKGVVCRNTDGSIKSVELLDLWEAREIYGREIIYSNEPVEKQVEDALSRASGILPAYTFASIVSFDRLLKIYTLIALKNKYPKYFIEKEDIQIQESNDSFERIRPSETTGCKVEQIAFVDDIPANDAKRVYLQKKYFDKMNNTNKAALNLHESIYASLRNVNNETNSIRTRRAVGFIFSGGSFNELLGQFNPTLERITCMGGEPMERTFVHFFESENGSVKYFVEMAKGMYWLGLEERNLIRYKFDNSLTDYENFKFILNKNSFSEIEMSSSESWIDSVIDFEKTVIMFPQHSWKISIGYPQKSGLGNYLDTLDCKLIPATK